jgi:formyltetrahydrofolate hydrolase
MVKGREIEMKVLADAVKLFIEHRIFVCGNRTIILS